MSFDPAQPSTSRSTTPRRTLLRTLAGSFAVPALHSLSGSPAAVASAAESKSGANASPRRFVAVGNLLGFQTKHLFPELHGTAFETTRLLEPLVENKDRLTIYRGLDHGIKGGHFAVHTFLSGVLHHESKSRPDRNVTIDQVIADAIGTQTRFASLTIGSEGGIHGGCQMAWTRSGVRIPPIPGPAELFDRLFGQVDEARRKDRARAGRLQASILDHVHAEAESLRHHINGEDREKLDEFFSSIRDVEKRVQSRRRWQKQPKPSAPFEPPANRNTVEDLPMLYELMALAIQTDSTRVCTLEIGGSFLPQNLGIDNSYHGLSHHGNDEKTIEKLIRLEGYQLEQFNKFLSRLANTTDGEQTLLDSTAVLFGSGMGDGNRHKNSDLPILMAGGGYGGRGLVPVPRDGVGKVPLCNLLLDIANRTGANVDQFGTSTGTFA